MDKKIWPVSVCIGILAASFPSSAQLRFDKQMIAAESYESVAVFDVNKDGKPDIVSGDFWYEGPGFVTRHLIGGLTRTGPNGEYWSEFATIPLDVNGDGYTDYVSGDWFSKSIWWRENPGNNGPWKMHLIDSTGNVESMAGWDVDGDGNIEIVPNNPGNPLKFYRLERDQRGNPSGKFTRVVVAERQDHGLGFGDINGDGRGDFIISNGWVEAPENRLQGKWTPHKFRSPSGEELNLGTVSVPVLVADVNGDGKNDLIVGQGHGYGLDWYEQVSEGPDKTSWIKHPIDPFNSQYHTMEWADIDGDGKNELISGKRYRAHNGNDPGSNDPAGLYYFKWNGQSFTKNTICYGPFGVGKGTGLYFAVADLHNSGRKDIIVAGKDGLYVFYNRGAVNGKGR